MTSLHHRAVTAHWVILHSASTTMAPFIFLVPMALHERDRQFYDHEAPVYRELYLFLGIDNRCNKCLQHLCLAKFVRRSY